MLDKAIAEMEYIVRRLTPVEGERLQGLPDNYTCVHFTEDMIDDKLLDDFIAIKLKWDIMNAKINQVVKPKTRAQMKKWLLKISENPPDGPRYKGVGNGWAINHPRWIAMNILNIFYPGWDYVRVDDGLTSVFDMTHGDDPGRECRGGVSPTIQARMGTGGNQVPLVMNCKQGGIK